MSRILFSSGKPVLFALRDLLVLIFPFPKMDRFQFAFIVHPRTEHDVQRRYPFARYLTSKMIASWLRFFWPITVSKITGVIDIESGRPLHGVVIATPLVAHQLISNRKAALNQVRNSVKLAERYGAKVIGLGGLTSSVTRGGLDLIDDTQAGLVTGRALTPMIVSQYVIDAINAGGLSLKDAKVAIVGAGGGIGSLTSLILAKGGFEDLLLIDLGRKVDHLNELSRYLSASYPGLNVKISHKVEDVSLANIIVTATNSPEALVLSEYINPGTIIVDDAQPTDLAPEVFERNDVVVISGGVISSPGIKSHIPLEFAGEDENFSCFGEVVAMAAHRRHDDFSIGYPSEKDVDEIAALAKELGITRGKFQNHTRKYSDLEIKEIVSSNS